MAAVSAVVGQAEGCDCEEAAEGRDDSCEPVLKMKNAGAYSRSGKSSRGSKTRRERAWPGM